MAGGRTYADGRTATDSAPLAATIAGGAITWAGLATALEQFGDDFEPDEFAGLVIRAEQRTQVWTDDDFIRASEAASGGPGSVLGRGLIGTIAGLPVFVSNRLASGHALVLKRNAIGVMYKRRPIVEQDRDILKRTTVVTTNMHYAVKRLNDKGVLDITIGA